ncbi:PIN domain-containing protein [Microbacterium sp. MEC084]|uniref:type II toxin-antitoxin system VapC family toxin n=1 Tax=unclassified Microbacterium TaxID=2609290 RepID=UPI0006FAAF28|nr:MULTISPECIES: type II toxin-antitoxin system VapC family toxin [unclassified Microbacterium]KQZ09905.1 hypothetical protein ASD19_11005 [Microbacterium sp. Root53]MCD1267782.1 PIN domain-containing protein [Microbacterium sp. MEC084]
MLAYFDTSAVVPLLIDEPASERCARAWDSAHRIASTALTYVEVHTALAQAHRRDRLSDPQHLAAIDAFEELWSQVTSITPSDALIRHAAALGAAHALRGYDAVHCATAVLIMSDDSVAVSGDQDLLRAWHTAGLHTIDVSSSAH